MADLVVQSVIKDRFENVDVAADFYDALDKEVDHLVEPAAQRAQDNDRKTVQPRDL
jgi:histone H3/H4